MGDILMFKPRPRPSRPRAERDPDASAQILFFLGVRYEPWVETPAKPPAQIEARQPACPAKPRRKKQPA